MIENSRLWLTAVGEPKAYSLIHFPYNNLTFEVAGDARTDALEDAVFDWALEFMRARGAAEAVGFKCVSRKAWLSLSIPS